MVATSAVEAYHCGQEGTALIAADVATTNFA